MKLGLYKATKRFAAIPIKAYPPHNEVWDHITVKQEDFILVFGRLHQTRWQAIFKGQEVVILDVDFEHCLEFIPHDNG